MKKNKLLIITILYAFVFQQEIIGQSNFIKKEFVDTIFSISLSENREFWVKLPDSYKSNSDQKYPVVYLLDGFSLQTTLETIYDNYWGHYLPHMILVGISNKNNRTRDLTTSKIKMRRGSVVNVKTGGATKFTQFIENELIPHIDNAYPTTPYRTIIGHSYAGLFTINMLLNHNHLFNNYIAIDPSLDWDNQKLLNEAKEKMSKENYMGKSLFVSLAAEQLHMWNEEINMLNIMDDTSEFTLFPRSIIEFSTFVESQKQNGLSFSWKVYKEDLHGTVPLPSIRDGLVFLFKWYQFKSPQKYNNPDTSLEELAELLKKQEEIYSTNFGYPFPPMIEEMLNGYGYMNLQMGQPEKAFMFFKLNIDYFPKSPTAYNSMADYYEAQNDIPNAIIFVKKAAELSDSEYYEKKILELKRMIN